MNEKGYLIRFYRDGKFREDIPKEAVNKYWRTYYFTETEIAMQTVTPAIISKLQENYRSEV